MITEHVMCTGDFRIPLKDGCPQDVLDALTPWDHICVFDQRLDPARFSDTQLKSMARWSGVLIDVPQRTRQLEVGGYGLALHLGDSDGVGPLFESAVANTTETFAHWISDLLPTAIVAGAISTGTGTLTCAGIQWVTPRQAIDWVCSMFSEPYNTENYEWRVNPDGTLDAGPISDLWVTDPASETLPPLLVARETGSQPDAEAVPTLSLQGTDEAERRVLKQVILAGTVLGGPATGSATAVHSLKDFHGNALVRTRVTNDPKADSATAERRAEALLEEADKITRQWDADLGDYQIQGQFRPGDWILVYDQQKGFTDPTCQTDYRGDRIWPQAVRVAGWTWAVSDGMGVCHRSAAGVWTDLSEYIAFEEPSTVVHLGDRPRESQIPDLVGLMQETVNNAEGLLHTGTNSTGTFVLDTANLVLKTANYVANTSGFALDGTGNAEFNDVLVRGTIYATAGTIGGLTIASNQITGTYLTITSTGALTCTSATISGTLQANTITGWLTASTGGGFRTASSGARVELTNANTDRVNFFDSSSNQGYIYMGATGLNVTNSSGGAYLRLSSNALLSGSTVYLGTSSEWSFTSSTMTGPSSSTINASSALYLQKGGATRIGIGSSVDLNDGSGSCYFRVGSAGAVSINVGGGLQQISKSASDLKADSGYRILQVPA